MVQKDRCTKTKCKLIADNTKIVKYKRIFDVLFSLLIIVVLSPLFLIIALVIKVISPDGPVFFRHKRIGLRGKEFNCYKFRTMLPNAEDALNKMFSKNESLKKEFEKDFKLKKDPRIIPFVGNFLRKTSLDELPQFINTLKGDMSIVGPRPIVRSEKEKYGRNIFKFLSVKPGITGLWQVSGRNNLSYEQRVNLDVQYVDKHNWLMDLKIIFKTFVVVLTKDGSY